MSAPAPAGAPRPRACAAPALLVLAALALVAALRWRLLAIPLERDEGDFAYGAQLLLDGAAPYAEAYGMRLPGVFAAYALSIAAFGASAEGIRMGLLCANAASSALLFALGRRVADAAAGAGTAVAFAALSLGSAVLGPIAHTEHFALLPVLGAFLLLAGPHGAWRAAAAGLLLGLAFATKQSAAPLVVFGVLLAAAAARRAGRSARRAALACAAAAAVPLLGVALAAGLAGSFASFWFWTLQYPLVYAAAPSRAELLGALGARLAALGIGAAPLLLLAAAGVAVGLRTARLRPALRLALAWLLFAFAAVALGGRFRPQHFVLLLPPLALLGGLAVSALGEAPRLRWPHAAQALLVAVAALGSLWGDRELLLHLGPHAASRALHGANPFPEAAAVGAWLREHSEPGDRIAVLGSEPEIYFYARRRAATPYVYAYELVQPHPYAARMQSELIERLEADPPRFVVFVNVGLSWQPAPGVRNRVLEWYRARVPGSYTQVGQVNLGRGRSEAVWGAAAARAPRSAQGWISIWERGEHRGSDAGRRPVRASGPAPRPGVTSASAGARRATPAGESRPARAAPG